MNLLTLTRISLLLGGCVSSAAGLAQPVTASSPQNSVVERTLERAMELEQSKQTLTPAEQRLAQQFQLSEDDWLKYKEIMTGPRSIWNPNLDPITTLGVEAKTEAERIRYAEIWMRVETQRTERELAFERARMKAAKRLYPDTPMMDFSNHISRNPPSGAPPQHYVIFAKRFCRTCASLIQGFSGGLRSVDALDVYVVDARSDLEVQQFAAETQVSIEKVRQGQITLNWQGANQRLSELNAPSGELPMAYGQAGAKPWQRMH